MRTINHFGIPTDKVHQGESYSPDMKLFLTDFNQSPNRIEFLRFEADSQMPELLQKYGHIAYEVPCLKSAMEGKDILVEPFEGGVPGLMCAFIVEEGVAIELMEYKK